MSMANNGEASKSADEILADARQAMGAASSVHVTGRGTPDGTPLSIDAVLSHGRGGGRIILGDETFSLVLDGQIVYIKADAATWSRITYGKVAIADLAGKWLKTTMSNPAVRQYARLLDISQFASILPPSGTVLKDPVVTVDGVPVIPLSEGQSDGGLLYVAIQGTPHIVAITLGNSGQGTMHFSQYNSATVPSPPPGAVGLAGLERPTT
jgi:hypothetical protein